MLEQAPSICTATTSSTRSSITAVELFVGCAVLGLAILAINPNYRWSDTRDEPLGADFLQEWVAGDMLLSGAATSIYSAETFNGWQHDAERIGFVWSADQYYPAVYPPTYYLLVAPLAALPYHMAVVLWLMLMLAAYAVAACATMRINPIASSSWHLMKWFWVLCLIFPPTFFGLVLGQKGTLWMAILAVSTWLYQTQRPMRAGLVAALLTLKPTLVLVLPLVMLLNRQWRFVAGMVSGGCALILASLLFVQPAMWFEYGQVVLGSATYQAHGGYHSGWSTSLLTLLGSLGLEGSWKWGTYAIVSVLVLKRLTLASQVPAALASAPEQWFRILCATALLSPHAYFYDLVWVLVPLSLMAQTEWRRAAIAGASLWLAGLWAQSFPDGMPIVSVVLLTHCLFRVKSTKQVGAGIWASKARIGYSANP